MPLPADGGAEFDWIFQRPVLRAVDPQRHAVRFASLVAFSVGCLTTAAEVIAEGPAPTLRQTVLVIVVRITIDSVVVFVGILLLGRYLGLVTRSPQRTHS